MAGSLRAPRNEFPCGYIFEAAGGILWEDAVEVLTQAPESNAKLLRWGDAGTIEIMSMNALLDRGLFQPVGWRRGLLGRRVRRGLCDPRPIPATLSL